MDYFKRLSIVANPAGLKTVHWTLNTKAGLPSTLDFYLDKARSGGPWTNVAGPLTDACHAVDPVRWNWNKDKNSFYRVRFQLDGEWQYSTPTQAIGKWTKEDYTVAKEICRREYLLLRRAGQDGLLLKRKEWGEQCSCVDYDTKEVTNDNCEICLGTGIVGGYHPGITLPILCDQPSGRTREFKDVGLAQDESQVARVVAYPLISPDDVWVNANTNERWRVLAVSTVAEIRRVPVVQKLKLAVIPRTNVIYSETANDKALEKPVEQPVDNEHGWETEDNANCINDFDY